MTKKIDFNYFYLRFISYYERLLENYIFQVWNKDTEKVDEYIEAKEIGRVYFTFGMSKDERLLFMENGLMEMCKHYASLLQISDVNPQPFDFLRHLLEIKTKSPYQESFLFFIQFFCRDYLEVLGKGCPQLMKSCSLEKEYQIAFSEEGKILSCEALNMNRVEEAQTILRVLTMEKNQIQGPIQNVRYIRK